MACTYGPWKLRALTLEHTKESSLYVIYILSFHIIYIYIYIYVYVHIVYIYIYPDRSVWIPGDTI